VVTLVGATVVWNRSTAIALRMIGARPCVPDEQPRLFNLTEGLCATFGVRMPGLWLVEDPVANACTLGRSAHEAVLVVTSGLLQRLGLIELEGLVAHELAHVKRHDTGLASVGVVVLAPYARLTGRDRLLGALVGPGREYRADVLAAATLRYPPGLRDALRAMAEGPAPAAASVFAEPRMAVSRWIWADPYPGAARHAGEARPDRTGPGRTGPDRAAPDSSIERLDVRIAALAEW
jgi:Zn-dependent protease with chaperone function